MNPSVSEAQSYDCQECGQSVNPQEFHSYDSCILYRWRFSKLTKEQTAYVMGIGLEILRSRVRDKVTT